MIIGLTGGIASGKSTVSKYLAEKGFKVHDADKIAKDISEKKSVQEEIILTFGNKCRYGIFLSRRCRYEKFS